MSRTSWLVIATSAVFVLLRASFFFFLVKASCLPKHVVWLYTKRLGTSWNCIIIYLDSKMPLQSQLFENDYYTVQIYSPTQLVPCHLFLIFLIILEGGKEILAKQWCYSVCVTLSLSAFVSNDTEMLWILLCLSLSPSPPPLSLQKLPSPPFQPRNKLVNGKNPRPRSLDM